MMGRMGPPGEQGPTGEVAQPHFRKMQFGPKGWNSKNPIFSLALKFHMTSIHVTHLL